VALRVNCEQTVCPPVKSRQAGFAANERVFATWYAPPARPAFGMSGPVPGLCRGWRPRPRVIALRRNLRGFFAGLSGLFEWWGDGDAGAAEVDQGDQGFG
jgi:hypothetical protein